jgi:hypothetical protein
VIKKALSSIEINGRDKILWGKYVEMISKTKIM